MFANRTTELTALEHAWQKSTANLFIVYGRRRVGKTELLKQFLKNKPGFYFLADRLPEPENLKTLSRVVRDFSGDEFLGDFDDWYAFFRYLKARIQEPTLIIFDEFPYLLETNSALSSVFQKGWDEYLKDLPVFLILCGSSIAMMHREALDYKAPLFGRRTGQLFVKPLRFRDFQVFFPNLDFSRHLELFAVSGGVPAYILQLDENLSLTENVVTNIFHPGAYLYEEVNFILKEEVREPRIYFSILKAIALGKRKLGEIVNATGIQKTSLHTYLYTLEELGLIKKEFPVTESNPAKSRKGLYWISDYFLRFWFNFIFQYHSEIEIGNLKPVLRRFDETFVHLAARCYEEVAAEILLQESVPFEISRIGRWWNRTQEIDLVGIDAIGENILFGEVKWSTNPVGTDILKALLEKSQHVDWPYRKAHYVLFSRAGFTRQMRERAAEAAVVLFEGGERISI